MEPINPLNDADCDCLNAIIESAELNADLLGKCKECGLRVDESIKANQEQLKQAKAIKTLFFPNRK